MVHSCPFEGRGNTSLKLHIDHSKRSFQRLKEKTRIYIRYQTYSINQKKLNILTFFFPEPTLFVSSRALFLPSQLSMTILKSRCINNNSGGYPTRIVIQGISRQQGRKEDDLGYKCYYTQAPLIFRVNSQWAFSAGLLLPLPPPHPDRFSCGCGVSRRKIR